MQKLSLTQGLTSRLFRIFADLIMILQYFWSMKRLMVEMSSIRRFSYLAVFLASCVLVATGCSRGTEEQRKRQSLPNFEFDGWDGGLLKRDNLPEDKPVAIFYFDPDCEHCQETMNSIVAQFDQFGDNTLVMISSADRSRVVTYLIEKDMLKRPGVLVGLCEPKVFLETFGAAQTPTLLFYGGDWDLKRAFKGRAEEANILDGLKAAREE